MQSYQLSLIITNFVEKNYMTEIMTHLSSARLTLRRWRETDAETLYRYASDPDVGNPAGWPPHTSVEMSLEVIRAVFSAPHTFAVALKSTDEAVGCCGVVPTEISCEKGIPRDDVEIGYWLGKPYWGQGIIPEAVELLTGYIENQLGHKRLWITFFDGNHKSTRVAEKCGFKYHHTANQNDCKELCYVRD